jgi:hypothetical protein
MSSAILPLFPVHRWRKRATGWRTAATLALLFSGVACSVELDEEALEGGPFEPSRERCVVAAPDGVSRGGAFSLAFPGGAYWIYDETWVDGRVIGSSGAVVAAGEDPCAGGEAVTGANGELAAIVPLTPDEEAANASSVDGRRIAIWPVSGFVHGDEGYVYFRKVRMKGYFDVIDVGVGVARVGLGKLAERVHVGKYGEEPTLLWLAPQIGWGTSAFVGADGYAYVYGCYQRAAWEHSCLLARVAPDEAAADAGAYRYAADGEWVAEVERAASVLADAPALSVAPRARSGKLLVIRQGFLEDRVYGREATGPSGPFGREHALYTGTAPESFWVSKVTQHPAHASADGKRVLTSYFTAPKGGPAGVRLVEVTLR